MNIDLPGHGFGFAAVHILASVPGTSERPGVAKTRFWDAILRSALDRQSTPFMFIGDFNTGRHREDELGKTFVCADHFGRLTASGWIDAWRHFNGSGLEATGTVDSPAVAKAIRFAWIMPLCLRHCCRVFGIATTRIQSGRRGSRITQ